MPKISLTTFVDFTASAGSTRLTKVRRAKAEYGEDYSPQKDFYKALREAIEESFEEGWSAAELKKKLSKVPDPKKQKTTRLAEKASPNGRGDKHLYSTRNSALPGKVANLPSRSIRSLTCQSMERGTGSSSTLKVKRCLSLDSM